MSNKPNKDLDKLFQQGSEQYDFGYNADAWEQMESLLDKDDHRRRWFWWLLCGLGLILLIGSIWFFGKGSFQKADSDPPAHNLEQVDTQENIADRKPEDREKRQMEMTPDQILLDSSSEVETDPQVIFESKKKAGPPDEKKTEAPFIEKDGKLPEEVNKSGETVPRPPVVDNAAKEFNSQGSVLVEDRNSLGIVDRDTLFEMPLARIPALLPALLVYTHPDSDPVLPENLMTKEKSGNARLLKKSAQRSKNALILGLTVETEMTSVGVDNFSRVNWKAGGQVEYRFAGNYGAGIGFKYMRKQYEAGKGEYIPPVGFWTRTIAPQSTAGACDLLEVPLVFSYYPKAYFRSGLYADAGLLSYFMFRERYSYFYDLPDPDLIRRWGTRTDHRYWFSFAQVSLGYHQILGPKTSIQCGSFFQFPLAGVGHGNVKLWNIGMSLKVNFQAN